MVKNIIFIGSNSSFVQDLLKLDKTQETYSKVYLISHRKYLGKKKDYVILDNIDPINIISILDPILTNTENILFDILVSNTPPKDCDFQNGTTKEWGLTSLKLLNYLNYSQKLNKSIFLGSSLALVPFIRKGIYKSIKKIEFLLFYELEFYQSSKLGFCLLPPLTPGVNGLGKLFSQSRNVWSKKILNEFNSNNGLIIPNGLIGIIIKFILLTKFQKL